MGRFLFLLPGSLARLGLGSFLRFRSGSNRFRSRSDRRLGRLREEIRELIAEIALRGELLCGQALLPFCKREVQSILASLFGGIDDPAEARHRTFVGLPERLLRQFRRETAVGAGASDLELALVVFPAIGHECELACPVFARHAVLVERPRLEGDGELPVAEVAVARPLLRVRHRGIHPEDFFEDRERELAVLADFRVGEFLEPLLGEKLQERSRISELPPVFVQAVTERPADFVADVSEVVHVFADEPCATVQECHLSVPSPA